MKTIKNPIFLGLYAYISTILVQYGFNSYFGIPNSFIEPSIRDNIIFFFSLSRGIINAISSFSFFSWFIVFLALVLFVVSMFFIRIPTLPIKVAVALIIITSPFIFYKLGGELAKTAKEFQVFSGNCLPTKDNTTYIIPAFYQTKAIVVPISNDGQHKISGGIFLKEPLDSECAIQNKEIGQILK